MTERILVLNISGIGDFIDSTPALKFTRELRPQAHITLLVSEKACELARRCPYVNEVIALPTSAGRSFPKWQDLPRWLAGIGRVRKRFDVAINLYNVASLKGARWIRLLLRWSGAALTIGANREGMAPFYSRALSPPHITTDQMECSLAIVALLDAKKAIPSGPRPEVWISDETFADVRAWIQKLPGQPIAVFLGGDRRTRHEFPARAEEWLLKIQERWPVYPIILGSLSDPGLPSTTRLKFTDMRGKTDIERTAAIIASSAALITTHSAPQHFASVWNTPTVVLVGPGDETRYRPHVDSDRIAILKHSVACAPCYYQDCPLPPNENKKCMTGISTESVVQAFGRVFRH